MDNDWVIRVKDIVTVNFDDRSSLYGVVRQVGGNGNLWVIETDAHSYYIGNYESVAKKVKP